MERVWRFHVVRIGLAFIFSVQMAFAQTNPGDKTQPVQVGRYSTVPAEPSVEQTNPLGAVVAMQFPRRRIKTVGDAIHHLLDQSGYRLADVVASDPAMQVLLTRPLPEVQRNLGPCGLDHALTTLAGPVYRLVVDPLHRLVSFEVANHYASLANASFPSRLSAASLPSLPSPSDAPTGSANAAVDMRLLRTNRRDRLQASSYGPVRANDTLLPIALRFERNRRASQASNEQVMLAAWQANRHAFGMAGGMPNLNFLKVGSVLRAPPVGAWRQWSKPEAKREVKRQQRLWLAYRNTLSQRQKRRQPQQAGDRHGRL